MELASASSSLFLSSRPTRQSPFVDDLLIQILLSPFAIPLPSLVFPQLCRASHLYDPSSKSLHVSFSLQLQEVFVLDSDDDAPPSRPLAADLPPRARPSRTRVVNGLGSSSNATLNGNGNGHFTRSSRNGTGTANGTGVAAEAGPSSSKAKGKRKANGSLSASESVGLDSVSDAGAQGSGSAPSTKRRKKDVNDVNTITQSATIAARNQAALAAQQSRALQIQNAQAQALLQQHQQQHHQHQQQQQQQYNQLYRPNVPSGSGYLAQQQQQQQAAWAAGARYANGSASYSEGVGSDRLVSIEMSNSNQGQSFDRRCYAHLSVLPLLLVFALLSLLTVSTIVSWTSLTSSRTSSR